MKMIQTCYKKNQWSIPLPLEMNSSRTLITAYFNSALHQSDAWQELSSKFPLSTIAGCSGAGEIKKAELVDDEIVVTFIQFESTEIRHSSVNLVTTKDSEEAGKALVKSLHSKDLKALYVLSDGLNVNGTALIKGITDSVGDQVTVSGGLAGDGTQFQNTFIISEGVPKQKIITAVGFYGDSIQVISSSAGGWKCFGPLRKITRSEANILYELDGKPALSLYKEFLGEQAKKLPASALMFPLHLGTNTTAPHRDIVRTILAVDEATQSMTFAGDVPQGTTVQLMRAGHEVLIDAARELAQQTTQKCTPTAAVLSLVVSCVGRRLVLGEKTESEIEVVLDQLPPHSVQTGFYSYGEIAPGKLGYSDLHNQTITLTFITERCAG